MFKVTSTCDKNVWLRLLGYQENDYFFKANY